MYSEVHILDTKNTKILISKDCPLPFCQFLYLIPYKRTLTFSVSFAVYHSSLSFSLSLSIYFLTHSAFLSPSSLPFPFEETKYLFSFILAACKWSVCTYVTWVLSNEISGHGHPNGIQGGLSALNSNSPTLKQEINMFIVKFTKLTKNNRIHNDVESCCRFGRHKWRDLVREGEEEGREYGKRLVIEMLKHLKIGTKECYFGQAIFSSSSLLLYCINFNQG